MVRLLEATGARLLGRFVPATVAHAKVCGCDANTCWCRSGTTKCCCNGDCVSTYCFCPWNGCR